MGEELVLSVAVAKEVDGLEMGVLADGTAYLTGRGVARFCGVVPSAVITQAQRWVAGDRSSKFAQMLATSGYSNESLHLDVTPPGGVKTYAFPEVVCMAFLEYYAFEATPGSAQAQQTFRRVARAGLRLFVYQALGYDPARRVPLAWRQFHDRLQLHKVPRGHFSVFREGADFVLTAIRAGLTVDDHTVPDISVGQLWSKHWDANGLDLVHGPRQMADHNYPEYFPQAASNPQRMWVYPIAALAAFRIWLQDTYLPDRFPNYLKQKVKKGLISPSVAELLLEEVNDVPAAGGQLPARP